MLDCGDKVRDHFFNPRNAGPLEGANAVGQAGSLIGGDAVRLMLQINPGTKVIEAARFLALGGSTAIASLSTLTNLVIGRTLDQVQGLTEADIADALDGLPADQMHGAKLGCQAFFAALAAFDGTDAAQAVADAPAKPRSAQPPAAIAYAARLARGQGPTPLPAHPMFARRALHPITDPLAAPAQATPGSGLADAETLFAATARIIDALRPDFRRDGGDIELLRVEAGRVFVHLSGACAGCMMAGQTLGGLQKRIADVLGQTLRIIPTERGRV